ncbi:MAG TPA: TonB family protein [Syntrophales bacterium]|nr:TonB family protein [Syntrophales bacterium]HPQ44189.1 TonB family protein [Syntrophales bacterium]
MTFLSEAMGGNHGDATNLNNMIVLSFLLHALILSIIFFSPSFPEPRWTFGPTYTVDLVSTPSSSVDVRSSEEISREVVGMDRKSRSMIMKKEVEKDLDVPIRETKILKKNPVENVDRAIENIKKKMASATATKEESRSSAATKEEPRPSPSGGSSEMNMKMKVYYSVIWSMIKEKWALPESILSDNDLETVIGARILKNGSVSELNFEKRSGNRYFDESALKAIKKVGDFPPLPEWVHEEYIDLGIRFHSSEL